MLFPTTKRNQRTNYRISTGEGGRFNILSPGSTVLQDPPVKANVTHILHKSTEKRSYNAAEQTDR